MAKKINTKPFCKAWNDVIKPKETWYDVLGVTQQEIDDLQEDFYRNGEAIIMQELIDNYKPPKRIKHESNIKRS